MAVNSEKRPPSLDPLVSFSFVFNFLEVSVTVLGKCFCFFLLWVFCFVNKQPISRKFTHNFTKWHGEIKLTSLPLNVQMIDFDTQIKHVSVYLPVLNPSYGTDCGVIQNRTEYLFCLSISSLSKLQSYKKCMDHQINIYSITIIVQMVLISQQFQSFRVVRL